MGDHPFVAPDSMLAERRRVEVAPDLTGLFDALEDLRSGHCSTCS